MEYLYSDEGQLVWLKGYCNPIRYDDLNAPGRHPGRPARRSCRTRPGTVLPTLDQITAAAKTLITEGWDDGRRRRRPVSTEPASVSTRR